MNSDQAEALKILDETGELSSMEEGRIQLQRKKSQGATTLPASVMQRAQSSSSPSADRWKKAGRRIAPDIMEEVEKPGELKALSRFGVNEKSTTRTFRRKGRKTGMAGASIKPSRWSDVLGAAKSADENSQWNDLLDGVGFGDTMQRLSSYYQNNAILAGLLATILFSTMSDARLFDLERGTLACPVSGPEPCMLTKSPYEPQQLKVSHYIF